MRLRFLESDPGRPHLFELLHNVPVQPWEGSILKQFKGTRGAICYYVSLKKEAILECKGIHRSTRVVSLWPGNGPERPGKDSIREALLTHRKATVPCNFVFVAPLPDVLADDFFVKMSHLPPEEFPFASDHYAEVDLLD